MSKEEFKAILKSHDLNVNSFSDLVDEWYRLCPKDKMELFIEYAEENGIDWKRG